MWFKSRPVRVRATGHGQHPRHGRGRIRRGDSQRHGGGRESRRVGERDAHHRRERKLHRARAAAGTYTVTASAKGFKTYVRENIILRLADRARIDVALEPGEVSEKVNVQGEAPLVETASTTLGDVVNTQQVAELPLKGRSLSSLLGLANGVVMLGTARQRSANGVSQTRLFDSGVRFLVDGGDSGQVDSDFVDSASASAARITRASYSSTSSIRRSSRTRMGGLTCL